MNRSNRHIHSFLSFAASIFLAVAATSCGLIYDYPQTPDEDASDESISYLHFEMTLPSFPTESRTPAGDYDPGTEAWENYIDYQNDIHIYLFKNDNTFLASLGINDILIQPQATVGSDYKKYDAIGIVHVEIPTAFKVVVMANCGGNYPTALTDIDDLVNNLKYTISSPLTTLTKDTLIPMFGVQEFSGLSIPANQQTDLGTIFMLRAVAKIEVCVDATEEHDLEYLKLVNYNMNGLCAPKNVYTRAQYVKNDYGSDYVTHVSLPSSSNENNTDNPWNFGVHRQVSYVETLRNVFTLYVPEYRNLVPDGSGNPTTTLQTDHSYMQLKFEDTLDDRVFNLEFKRYNVEGQPYFDIQRNNYYKYTVKRVDSYLHIEVDVIPYNHIDLNPEFGIDRDENGNPIDKNGNIITPST